MDSTLVVVTCQRDKWNFDLLCRSIGKFLKPCKIVFVYNESVDQFRSWKKTFKRQYLPYLIKFDVNVMYRDQFWTAQDENHLTDMEKCGWTGQQVIKLAVSKYVTTEHYLVLDAKNFFIDHTALSQILQIYPETTDWCTPILKNWIVTCFETFDLQMPSHTVRLTQNTTPYWIRTDSARNLVDFFGGSGFLYKWFTLEARKARHSPSEFFLYEIYTMRYGHRNLGRTHQNCVAFWEEMHTQEHYKIKDYLNFADHIKTFNARVAGIHGAMRHIWTNDQAYRILCHLGVADLVPDNMPFKKD